MNLSSDPSFNFNRLRWLGGAPYHGANVAEVLTLAGRLTAGDFGLYLTICAVVNAFDVPVPVGTQPESSAP
ncbi:MAG: hypothetical protein J2P28_07300 [Actinobacteria bacterium]|nr:hypothetical protein [Actinomycetota bacterium]MBO0835311.1 hypothetical protein [Actinomycetota bacterium]